ncbi:MAG: hypothetical protein RBT78_11485 [Kiritimatiellia bacterium]|nr:hypothetical protein [Kiritimatiellia bacterium]
MNWTEEFDRLLPLLGHRNWILVTDQAYPYQSAPGITCLDTRAPLPEVLARVAASLRASAHVKPVFHTDLELRFLTEELAPGIDAFRAAIRALLPADGVRTLPHESVFAKLDAASKLFHVVVLKTDCVLPYSSVFIELDCAYWDADREKALRDRVRVRFNETDPHPFPPCPPAAP